ncbi:MAG: methyltransferase domain-containing protein [Phycisphaerales bacterium]
MKSVSGIGLKDVQGVYSGPEGRLWELIMGEQIHIGGLTSSMDLAEQAGIQAGSKGVDLCCCSGAGMRFLVRFRNVARMVGVDATKTMVELGTHRCQQAGLADRIQFALSDVCCSGLEVSSADFVWGEDAWCYVVDKNKLIAEAARIVRPGGVIAFTDWVEGKGLSQPEADRFLRFMKFANLQSIGGYSDLLKAHGCDVLAAKDTGRFSPCIDLYLNMLGTQLTYDALQIIGFDQDMMKALAAEMAFAQQLAHAGKIVQGLFVARKKG